MMKKFKKLNTKELTEQEAIEVLQSMAEVWDKEPPTPPKTQKRRSAKQESINPQILPREDLARRCNRLADLCRGIPMSEHDEKMGYSREYIMYMLATQILHQVRIEFKESFTSERS